MWLVGALSRLSEVLWEDSGAGNGTIISPNIYFTALNAASCLTLGILLLTLTSLGCLAAQVVCCANLGS